MCVIIYIHQIPTSLLHTCTSTLAAGFTSSASQGQDCIRRRWWNATALCPPRVLMVCFATFHGADPKATRPSALPNPRAALHCPAPLLSNGIPVLELG